MSDHHKSNWLELELELEETPSVVHAPDDPYCDADGFVALPPMTELTPSRPTSWLRWSGVEAGAAGEA